MFSIGPNGRCTSSRNGTGKLVNNIEWPSECFRHIFNSHAKLIGHDRGGHGGMFDAEAIFHPFYDLIAPFTVKIDIDIRSTLAAAVKKPFEQQVMCDGVHARDPQ